MALHIELDDRQQDKLEDGTRLELPEDTTYDLVFQSEPEYTKKYIKNRMGTNRKPDQIVLRTNHHHEYRTGMVTRGTLHYQSMIDNMYELGLDSVARRLIRAYV